jgi:hypothetical protein
MIEVYFPAAWRCFDVHYWLTAHAVPWECQWLVPTTVGEVPTTIFFGRR